jgi:hypothetical protein
MMLGKWLDYLLDMGHSFRPVSDLVKPDDRCAATLALPR